MAAESGKRGWAGFVNRVLFSRIDSCSAIRGGERNREEGGLAGSRVGASKENKLAYHTLSRWDPALRIIQIGLTDM